MAEEGTHRRLAAILAADVVNYSRLMHADEVQTLADLKARWRDVLDPLITRHEGRLFKVMGDGVLVEFGSAVNAVQCSLELQNAFADLNARVSDDRKIVFRIGVHLGDVMIDGTDLYGDGVNIASRLESLAEPGGVLLSEDVYRQINNKLDLSTIEIGPQNLKNIAQPVRAYRIAGLQRTSPAPQVASIKVSIVVLPFANMSGDPEQTYFSDGITEDIISELSRFRELRVVGRNSSFKWRDGSREIREIGRQLDVQFVIEGSVRRSANRLRISVQLIDAVSEAHVWSERFDREPADIFDIQDEIARAVAVRAAGLTLTSVVERLRSRPTESLSAYDLFLRARKMHWSYEENADYVRLLQRCIELDPRFASAYALLADYDTVRFFFTADRTHLERALATARKAVVIDPDDPWANNVLGLVLTYRRSMSEAGHYLRRAVELNHNESTFQVLYALWLSYTGRGQEALATINKAFDSEPSPENWMWSAQGIIFAMQGLHEDAIRSYANVGFSTPSSKCILAVCLAKAGDEAQARALLDEVRSSVATMTPSALFETIMPFDPQTMSGFVGAIKHIEESNIAHS